MASMKLSHTSPRPLAYAMSPTCSTMSAPASTSRCTYFAVAPALQHGGARVCFEHASAWVSPSETCSKCVPNQNSPITQVLSSPGHLSI